MKLLPLILAVVLAASRVLAGDYAAAAQDRLTLPQSAWPFVYYFSTEHIPRAKQEQFARVLSFMLASSSQQQIVEYCTPTQVGDTLWRIDTRSLQWDAHQAAAVFAETPYRRDVAKGAVLVNDPAWLIVQLGDSSESKAYNRLLHGRDTITRKQLFEAFEVNENPTYRIGVVEGQSGVSVESIRWLMNFPASNRTDTWGTLDFLSVDAKTDPMANLDYPLERWEKKPIHDGEEWISGMPKVSITSKERGRLQAYALLNKQGNGVDEAPGRLVRGDGFRGHGVIVNVGSCISCHTTGLNAITRDEVREYLVSGATISTKNKADSEKLDLLVLNPTERLLDQANEEYARGVKLVCGMEPAELSAAFVDCVDWYDAAVTIQQAAAELRCTTAELRLALAWRETRYNDLHPRQASLAQESTVPRKVWEGIYYSTYQILAEWRSNRP